jgi:hypothetical protein
LDQYKLNMLELIIIKKLRIIRFNRRNYRKYWWSWKFWNYLPYSYTWPFVLRGKLKIGKKIERYKWLNVRILENN